MTVESTNNQIDHTGTGSQTEFSYNFPVLVESHMEVYFDGVLQPSSGWSIPAEDLGQPNGRVIFQVAPANGVLVTLFRRVPNTQLIDYRRYDPFPSRTHESALDLLTMQIQQIVNETLTTLQYQELDTVDPAERLLPLKAARLGKAFFWDATTGVPIAGDLVGVPATTWGAAWVQLVSDAAARAQLQVPRLIATPRAPTSTDDVNAGYKLADLWLDVATGQNVWYVCMDATAGNASWTPLYRHLAPQLGYDIALAFVQGAQATPAGRLDRHNVARAVTLPQNLAGTLATLSEGGHTTNIEFDLFWNRATFEKLAKVTITVGSDQGSLSELHADIVAGDVTLTENQSLFIVNTYDTLGNLITGQKCEVNIKGSVA